MFNVENITGLSTLLSGGVNSIKEAIHFNVASGVDLMTSGVIPPNPSELLGHSRMENLLDAISQNYQYIFIDMPPVNVVSDALLLAKLTSGAIVIARQRQTTIDELRAVLDKYQEINAPVLGVAITDASREGRGVDSYASPYGYYEYK
jgi:capsular exopolysaccharide synthesis family protein